MTTTSTVSFSDLVERWSEIVGPQFAAETEPVALEIGGVIHVRLWKVVDRRDLTVLARQLLTVLPSTVDGMPLRHVKWHPPAPLPR
jgi:hypothetical protein